MTAQFNSEPISGFVVDYWGGSADRAALTQQDQAQCPGLGCTGQIRWSGVFGSRVSAEAAWARNGGGTYISVHPFEGHGSPFYVPSEGLFWNGATFDGIVERPRTQVNVAASVYHELFGNAAQFKAGVDYQILKSLASYTYPNNELFIVNDFDPALGQNQNFQVGDEWDRLATPVPSVSRGKIWGFYGLEKMEVGRLSLNLGARVEHQTGASDIGNSVIDSTRVSPRLYAAFDVMGDGKTLISGGYGRYYQFVIQALADSVFSGVPVLINRDIFRWDGSAWVFQGPVVGGGSSQPVNSDLNPSYTDEFNIAFQRQIGATMAVGVRGIYRKWYNLIEDIKDFNEAGSLIQTPFNADSSVDQRNYKGLEFTFEKRFSNHWQALINYTLSRARGNAFSDFGSQLFDFPNNTCNVTGVGRVNCADALTTNRNGIAAYDRTHIVNLFTAYTFTLPFMNLTAAPTFTYFFGLPYQQQRGVATPDGATTNTYFYSPRGSSRLPATYQLDMAVEATFMPFGNGGFSLVGGPVELGFKAECFNITDQQETIRTDFIRLVPDANFGVPTSRSAQQAPRGFRFSGLLRF